MIFWSLAPSVRLTIAAISVAGGCGFLIYSTYVTNNLQIVGEGWLNNSHIREYGTSLPNHKIALQWAAIIAAKEVGKIAGTLLLPLVAEKSGRQAGLLLNCVVTLVGSFLCLVGVGLPYQLKELHQVIMLGRFLLGISMICGVGLASMFLIEAAPTEARGWSGSLIQIFRGFGGVMGMFLALPEILGTPEHWNICLAIPAIPAALQFFILLMCKESPRHLYITKNKRRKAITAIKFYMGPDHIDPMLADLQKEKDTIAKKEDVPFLAMLSRKEFFLPMSLTVLLLTNRSLAGILLIQSYSTDVFMSAGLQHHTAARTTVALGVIHMISATFVTFKVEQYSRKSLLIGANVGSLVCLAGVGLFAGLPNMFGAKFFTVVCMIGFMAVYPVVASVSNIVASEICHQRIRSRAFTLGLLVYSIVGFVSTFLYPILKDDIGITASFMPYVLCMLATIHVYRKHLPETKGRSFQSLAADFDEEAEQSPPLLRKGVQLDGAKDPTGTLEDLPPQHQQQQLYSAVGAEEPANDSPDSDDPDDDGAGYQYPKA